MATLANAAIEAGTAVLRFEGTLTKEPARHTLQVGKDLHLQPDGRPWAFLNHSCDPNSRIDFTTWTLVATRRIERGEQVTFNYLTTEWDLASPFPCACGAEACKGWIRGLRYLPIARRSAVAESCSPYLRDCLASFDPEGQSEPLESEAPCQSAP